MGHVLLPQPYHWIWIVLCGSLYYCLKKHCLKHCVCFYQAGIPQEILKIISMFVYIWYMFLHYFDLTNYQNCHHLHFQWSTPFHCVSFFGWFASKEIMYRSLHFTCFSQWLLWSLEIKERFLRLDDGVNNDHSNVVV